jgi:hypothetical protein
VARSDGVAADLAVNYGPERAETDEAKAERIIAAELKRRNWTEVTLGQRPKRDAVKVKLAVRLRAETMQTVESLARRLQLGSRAYAHHLLWRARRNASRCDNNKAPHANGRRLHELALPEC